MASLIGKIVDITQRALARSVGAFGLGIVITSIVWGLVSTPFAPVPYTDVRAFQIERVGDDVEFKADFIKNDDCTFSAFVPFNVVLGHYTKTTYEDMDGRRDNEDRLAGFQTLQVLIKDVDPKAEAVELRTRHICGNDSNGRPIKVSKTFYVVDLL